MTLGEFNELTDINDPAVYDILPADLILDDGTQVGDHREAKGLPPGKRFGQYTITDLQILNAVWNALSRKYNAPLN